MIFLYNLFIVESADKSIDRIFGKNKHLREAMNKKIRQIVENPYRFKPLHPPFQNTRRVHVARCFVLIYEILENEKAVKILKFAHHDDAYKA